MATFTGLHRKNKTLVDNSYRPFIELSCNFCQNLGQPQSKLLASPLVVADVGARGGFDPRWSILGNQCVQIGFEPDPEEFQKVQKLINQNGEKDKEFILPYALWHEPARKTLHITKEPAASSLYMPNADFFARLPDPTQHQVVKQIEIETTTLDLCKLPSSHNVDVLKMDVQGAELDILKGAKQHIKKGMLAVMAETMFTPHYIDQPFFADMDIFLREQGFCIIDIDFRRWRRKILPKEFDGIRVGQVSYADVLYLKDPVEHPDKFCDSGRERDQFIKLIALAEYFSVPDYAIEMAETAHKKELLTPAEYDSILELLQQNKILKINDRNKVPNS